ncbi:unnamed protein product [Spirodela intermedia]|uniref:Uncharacterized protein n=2 Tax=Spirodela intermedia TaxID=51605 RepID=A0A7I8J848_SPIIN|nr:unnamed protein product [Spirodela intermedia]CAA6666357.1 unnamed protein product [Spirodela intermedia]CAA7403140.1 unnamed protein product [Spirodela intermedia]
MDRPQSWAENGVAQCIAQRLTDVCHAKKPPAYQCRGAKREEEASNSQRSDPRWHYKIARQHRRAGRRERWWERGGRTGRERC